MLGTRSLDPGVRRGDETFFDALLDPGVRRGDESIFNALLNAGLVSEYGAGSLSGVTTDAGCRPRIEYGASFLSGMTES